MNCFNCGHQDVAHIAMYCNEMPQKMLRCTDQRCWAAARNTDDHSRFCAIRNKVCETLDTRDQIHKMAMRFHLTLMNQESAILRLIPGLPSPELGPIQLRSRSAIADDIEFEWTSTNIFDIYGPETMYFRVLIAINESCVARFDVSYQKAQLLMYPLEGQVPLNRYRDATKMNQTAAILVLPNDELFEIETATQIFRMRFTNIAGTDMYRLSENTIKAK